MAVFRLHFFEKPAQGLEAGVDFLLFAATRPLVEVLAASLAKTLTVVAAKKAEGKRKLKAFGKELVKRQETVFHHHKLVNAVLGKVLRHLGGNHRALHIEGEAARNVLKTPRTGRRVTDR